MWRRLGCAGCTLLADCDAWAAAPEVHVAIDVAGQMAVLLAGLKPSDGAHTSDFADALRRIPGDVDQHAWAKAAVALSARTLAANVETLASVAAALMERGVLSGDELGVLLGTVRAACGCTPPDGVTAGWRRAHGSGLIAAVSSTSP